ncbi:MAG: hypothetical protein Ct9H300mP21_10060 [Pseudomonadota bacterium]|nr:MAG: hypothetical protein Ct9H300mP21_10060 [Pseudomonadota bacterium]
MTGAAYLYRLRFYKFREYGSHLPAKCMYLSLFLFETNRLKNTSLTRENFAEARGFFMSCVLYRRHDRFY